MNFTRNVPKLWRESSRLLTWLDLRIIIHKHHSKMYKLMKVSSLGWTWGSSDMDCTPRIPNISICWKRIFQNPLLDGVAGMMEIIRYELYLIKVQLFDILEKYPQWSLNSRPCKLGDWLITSSLQFSSNGPKPFYLLQQDGEGGEDRWGSRKGEVWVRRVTHPSTGFLL
jgi:hypothetical protein